jgi:hypothetical protein
MAAPNYIGQAGIAVSGTPAQIDAVNTWLNTLSSSDRDAAIKTLQGGENAGSLLGDMTLPWSQVNPMPAATLQTLFTQLQSQYKPAPVTQTAEQIENSQATQAQNTATTAATTATAQLPDQTTLGGPGAEGIPVVGAAGADIPGTSSPSDFNSLLADYYATQFQTAGTDPNQLAQLAGTTPQVLQSLYQSYTTGFAKAQQNPSMLQAHSQYNQNAQQPMSLSQFAQQKAQNMIGPWSAVLAAINGIYQSQEGVPMPADLVTTVVTQLNQMPQSQQSNVLYEAYQYMTNAAQASANKQLFDQTGSFASAILTALPTNILSYSAGSGTDTGTITADAGSVGTYMSAYPSAQLQRTTITAEIADAFQQALNRAPNAADIAALGSDPTPDEITNYIAAQPMPGVAGMTYGAYHSALAALNDQNWAGLFGKPPSTAEIRWAVGKSGEDISSFINNSQSSIPGITIGEKNDYETFIDGLDKGSANGHGLSAQIDDSMISDLHSQITKASTGTAKPGAM